MFRKLTFASILWFSASQVLGAGLLFQFEQKARWAALPLEVAGALPDNVMEEYPIAVAPEIIAANPDTIEFDLPDGRSFVAQRMHYADYGEDWKSWAGVTFGATELTAEAPAAGWVQFHYHGDTLTGIINLSGENYEIDTAVGQQHLLLRRDPLGPSCGLAQDELASADQELQPEGKLPLGNRLDITDVGRKLLGSEGVLPNKMTHVILDVLALYPAGLSSLTVSKIQSEVQDGIAVANNIFQQSSVQATYNLVNTLQISGVPTNVPLDWRDWLDWMTGSHILANKRQNHQADIVVLVIPNNWGAGAWCGGANLPQNFGSDVVDRRDLLLWDERAFSVLRLGCGKNDMTLAHEIGHNYGLRHRNGENTNSVHLFPNGRAIDNFTVSGIGNRATVMGCVTNNNGGVPGVCDRWPVFSDHPGGLAGDATHQNAPAARQQVITYSQYLP